ncbi:hypothetical protein LJB99_02610 [Deltaproteobacteria bacterium OttesenSCG-928-K17]|nr:hypothetical protein [Deltaproteobacteria bacterium OttesenSCG-928-K17]
MSEPSLAANERISRRFFNLVLDLIKELEEEGDQEGLTTLPTVMLTTGVIGLCQSMSTDTVSEVLGALRLKVERGDFTGNRDVDEA